ncbi:MAG: hypothetical protein Q7S27_04740 [Nanoarchaeota archaeon]|nr:hypothetical protein [Nanoarchaeota archaeon]
MAEAVKQKTESKKRGIKKGFYEVEAPLTAVKISLYGGSMEEFEGRVVNLDLTKSLRGRSLELRMKIKNEDGKLKASPVSANLAGSYIRRALRRGSDYVEDSFKANCRDAVLVVKPFMITRRRVSREVRNAIRVNARKFIEGYLKIRTTKELFSDIIANKLQRGMAAKLKKIYPLAMCEIRVFEIIGEKALEDIKEEERKQLMEEQGKEEISEIETEEENKEEIKKTRKKE